MASIKSVRAGAPKFMSNEGSAYHFNDKVVLAANPSVSDVLQYTIPAGAEISRVDVQADPLDTNATKTIAFSVGYAPTDPASSLAANATYFAAAGQTTAQAGGRLSCAFKPLTFQEDVYVTITFGAAAATFQAGEIWTIVSANTDGPK